MNALKVIESPHKDWPDYAGMHLRAATRSYTRYMQTKERSDVLKAVNHGVRAVIALDKKSCPAQDVFALCESVITMLRQITPRELMQVFPVDKVYDGEKWQIKDYHYTMKAMEKYGLDRMIGESNPEMLLWDYMNKYMRLFQVTHMCATSDLYRCQAGEGIMEKFCREQGIRTYTVYTDPKTGKRYLYDEETEQYTRIKKTVPRYMKVLSGGKAQRGIF